MPNKCNLTLEAHLGGDVEIKTSSTGKLMANFSVAFSQGKKDDPNKKPPTWFRCRAVGDAAIALQDCRKGEAVVINRCIPETWKDRDGNDRIQWIVFEAKKWEKQGESTPPSDTFDDSDLPF